MTDGKNSLMNLGVAVIGMAGRFPGAKNIAEFWANLKNGVESIAFFTDEELWEMGIDTARTGDANYVKAKGYLEDIDGFDFGFFGYSPKEAALMSPQMRIFHECAWEALEDAACVPDVYPGLIGVYAGASSDFDWKLRNQCGDDGAPGGFAADLLTGKDFISTRVSYKLNLKGPSYMIDTACSTSLAAVHLACRGLLTGDCDLALAGGVSVSLPPKSGYFYQEGLFLSPDGHCRAFDKDAGGTVAGNGVGIVVLKKLKEALRDGDHIYAVIRSSAVNNDGASKAGYTAPGVSTLAGVIKTAHRLAGIKPDSICFVEAHGSGTRLGDAVEIEALNEVFGPSQEKYCAVGSVKTNIGHLDSAAGIAGFIKAVLALRHRELPPSLHFVAPNPQLRLEHTPFYINTARRELKKGAFPLRAGVNSFGIGGNNVHVVLEEAPEDMETSPPRNWNLLTFSAKTPTALEGTTRKLAEYLRRHPGVNVSDLAYTLQTGRGEFKYRSVFLCSGGADAAELLVSGRQIRARAGVPVSGGRRAVFLFPGQGAQYVDMGRELYRQEPGFKEELDRCFLLLEDLMGEDLRKIVYPEAPDGAKEILDRTYYSQPVLFAFEYAMAKLLLNWGVKPCAMLGQSLGEYVAACLAGVFPLEEALRLLVARAKILAGLPKGAMLSVPLSETKIEPYLNEELETAIINSRSHCVVAGTEQAVERLAQSLAAKGVEVGRLAAKHAFHSQMMNDAAGKLREIFARTHLGKPEIPFVSNVYGAWITGGQAADPGYWSGHLTDAIRFTACMDKILEVDNAVFIDLGPGNSMGAMLQYHAGDKTGKRIVSLLKDRRDSASEAGHFYRRIGDLWLEGLSIDWRRFYALEKRVRLSLPTYAFDRPDFQTAAAGPEDSTLPKKSGSSGEIKKEELDRWFYVPSWKRSYLAVTGHATAPEETWMVFSDKSGLASTLVALLQQSGRKVVTVTAGAEFAASSGDTYILNPKQPGDYEKLFSVLAGDGFHGFSNIVHMWGRAKLTGTGTARFQQAQELGFYSVLHTVRLLSEELDPAGTIRLFLITSGLQEVNGERLRAPEFASLFGLAKVIPQEYPNFLCHSVDLDATGDGDHCAPAARVLLNEFFSVARARATDPVVAYRNGHRWVQIYEPVSLPSPAFSRLKDRGVYLLCGGLGNIGLCLAEYLAESCRARLVLTGRSFFPPRAGWEEWLAGHAEDNETSAKIRRLRRLEEKGAEVMIVQADIADEKEMRAAVKSAEERFGAINGVIHAAGIVGSRGLKLLSELEQEDCERQFRAKGHGLLVLERVLDGRETDFCLLISSLASVLGGIGMAAYTAGNLLLDAFVTRHNQTSPVKWTGVNWDTWLVKKEEEKGLFAAGAFSRLKMTPEEGLVVLAKVMALPDTGRLVISVGDLEQRFNRWVKLQSLTGEDSRNTASPGVDDAVALPASSPVELEDMLVQVWNGFFGLKNIGVEDDFFALGGDSLKAIELVAKINKVFGVRLKIAEFFAAKTIKKLAQTIKGIRREKTGFPAVKPAAKRAYYPATYVQKAMVMPKNKIYASRFNLGAAFVVRGALDPWRYEAAAREVIARHETLRTSFPVVNGEIVQKVHEKVDFHLNYLQTGETDAVERMKSFVAPFDLEHAPLWRVEILRAGEDKYYILHDMHHIIYDEISLNIVHRDLWAVYRGESPAPPAVQYKDYAVWLDKLLSGGHLAGQERFWLDKLCDYRPAVLRGDRRGEDTKRSHQQARVVINREEYKRLEDFCSRHRITRLNLLIGLFLLLLAGETGEDDIGVGLRVSNRFHDALGDVVGCFLEKVVIRAGFQKNPEFMEYLDSINQNIINAIDNALYPYELLNQHVMSGARAGKAGNGELFSILVNYMIVDKSPVELPEGLAIEETFGIKEVASKYNINFKIADDYSTLVLQFKYESSLYSMEMINRILAELKRLVLEVSGLPGRRIHELKKGAGA